MGWIKSRNFEKRAWWLFQHRFLRAAESSETQQHIDGQLADKVAQLTPGQRADHKLRRVVEQASQLWAHRSNLRKRDLLYLAAALLYFISPVDAVPDFLPGVGYVDDVIVVSAIVAMVVKSFSMLGARGKEQLEEWIDQRTEVVFQRLEETATSGVQRTVAAVAIGLWGATTAAAISLSVATVLGTYPIEWLAYVAVSVVIVVAWNVCTAVYYWREYRKLDGVWQVRLRRLVASKLTPRHLIVIGVPVLILIGLGIWRAVSYMLIATSVQALTGVTL
jgi:uncharacterized membrane protein YkvA (DUF1232 family)